MSRKLKLPWICSFFIILTSHSLAEVELTDIVENIYPAVVTVITFDKDKKPLGQGSGFFIDSKGHLITNYHVLEGAYYAVAKTYDEKKYLIKSVIGENKEMDLIKVLADISGSSVQWINTTRVLPSIAERVIVIGSPMGLELTVSEGIVSSVREIPDLGKILQISAAISQGSSGGPVVNMKGQVIGVVSFYLIKGQSLNFAIPAKYLLDLKPSKTIKTISEWTYGVDKKIAKKTPRQGRLFVSTEPKEARVRILNIKPKFYQGIELTVGSYHVEVSAPGHQTVKQWIALTAGKDKYLSIQLKQKQKAYESAFGFSIELSSRWTILSRQEFKENLDLFEPYWEKVKKTVLRTADKNAIEKLENSVLSGGIEFYFHQDYSGVNINVQKSFGRLPQTHAELDVFCKMLPDHIVKAFGVSTKIYKCEQINVGGLTATYVVYEALGMDGKLILYQIPKSQNVILNITAFSENQYFEIIENEFDKIMASFKLKKTGD